MYFVIKGNSSHIVIAIVIVIVIVILIVIVFVFVVIMGGFVSTYWSPLWDGEFADFTELEVQCNINSYSFNNNIIIIKNRMYIIV